MTWYKEGLRFHCTGCGACCGQEPGYVWLSQDDIEAMSSYLGITEEEFLRRYTRSVFGKRSLKEKSDNYDCIFLKDTQCTLYPVRPRQCRTFPWWKDNLESPATWQETAARCEGIDHPEAPVVPFDIIEQEKDG